MVESTVEHIEARNKPHLHGRTTSDASRARELYKYFRPPVTRATADLEPPDTVLTAHAQLVACRFNAQRAMVSLIDKETQYFVAESTKTLHLDDTCQHDHPDDAIWAGCISVPKAGRLCEHTIAATLPPRGGGPAYFEVLDLFEDDRFNKLDFVAGPPHCRYYIGVPLRTRKGINIGSIFALDDKVRHASTRNQRHFLGVMADNVVQHLEMMKERQDNQRSLHMNRCLSTFVDPERQGWERSCRPNARNHCVGNEKQYSVKHSRHSSSTDGDLSSSTKDSDSRHAYRVGDDQHFQAYGLGANLLCDALDLQERGGGVVFLDTAPVAHRQWPYRKNTTYDNVSSENIGKGQQNCCMSKGNEAAKPKQLKSPTLVWGSNTAHSCSVEIIAQAHHPPQASTPPQSDELDFMSLSPAEVSLLIRRHPRGRLFTFEDDGLESSPSDERPGLEERLENTKWWETTAPDKEIALLRKCFPSARQLIFLPLWDATMSRWSVCFAYNCSQYRNFSTNIDFLYCVAFCNCIVTEIARLATTIADRQKNDFISSISHELRSPLHGILGSCEFLRDTECTSFQRSLVDTADSCARTLLDTISMVLDYSKINAFERNTTKVGKSKEDILVTSLSLDVQSHPSTYGNVDLAAITEEVVEGVATGHVFRAGLAGADVHDIKDTNSDSKRIRSSLNFSQRRPGVKIILDIPRRDWIFWGQAGALKRIVMNLFGNSIKYTKDGFIHIKLDAESVQSGPGSDTCTYVTMTVTDTGQGISPVYMKTKLFTPFAQESSLASGTGLGLSLVKSIVDMLQGEIDIVSTVEVGTKVTVKLPMTKGTSTSSEDASTPTSSTSRSSVERVKDDSIKIVKSQSSSKTVAIFGLVGEMDTNGQREAHDFIRKSITTYLEDWYGFESHRWDHSTPSDIIITEETDLQALVETVPRLLDANCHTKVLVLCHTESTQTATNPLTKSHNFEEIRYPFGPYKLARALRICLENQGPETHMASAVATIVEELIPPSMEQVITAVENMTIASAVLEDPDIRSVKTGPLATGEDGVSAQMTMNNVATLRMSESPKSDNQAEFPFSADRDSRIHDTVLPTVKQRMLEAEHPSMLSLCCTTCAIRQEMSIPAVDDISFLSSLGSPTDASPAMPPLSKPSPRSPRILLVDDNKINLKLLQALTKKRKYNNITKAEDGLEAVNTYEQLLHMTPPEPPDIILMDISMPVMDGFKATCMIREIEAKYHEQLPPLQTLPRCFIIALTGLASENDRSNAFTSGFDLYITKPARFAEISRLLDKWEANNGAWIADNVLHSAAVAGTSTNTPAPALMSPEQAL